jgi:tetratricopeptide (TPR) repeat protein
MSRSQLSIAALAASLFATSALAQSILIQPNQSQQAQVMQRVGITDVTIIYHRPLVKGRRVFGNLIPWGQVWRAGANENTTISFSKPVSVEGKPIAAGTYGLHMIPNEKEWTVIFSKANDAWGSYTYKQEEDALRVNVKPQSTSAHEALTYSFEDLKPDQATVTLSWDKTAVPFKVTASLEDAVFASMRGELRGGKQYQWGGWDEAANYLLDHHGNLEEALKDSDQSLQYEERFDNLITKSRILAAMGKKDDASAAREKALAVAKPEQVHGYGRGLQALGKQDEAFDLFRANIKRSPEHWAAHNENARFAVAKGDYATAVKEMKQAVAVTDPSDKAVRPQLEALVKRLEAKEDINK